MFKRLMLVVLLVMAMAIPAYALTPVWDSSNLEVGVEYGYSHQDIESVNTIGAGIGSFLDVDIVNKTENVKEWSFLATLGYKVCPMVTPYLILGEGFINLDQSVSANIRLGDWSESIGLLTTQLRGASGFVFGGGAKGDLLEFTNGIKIGYDTRWTTFTADSNERSAVLLPGMISYNADNDMEATMSVFNFDMVVSRYFDLVEKTKNEDGTTTERKKYGVEGITPFIGGRYTHSDLNVKNDIGIEDFASIRTESELQGNMISAIGGINVAINKHLDASIGGIVGQENGVQVKCIYRF